MRGPGREGGEVAIRLLGEPWITCTTPEASVSCCTLFTTQDSASLEPCGVRMKDMN